MEFLYSFLNIGYAKGREMAVCVKEQGPETLIL